MIGLSKLNGQSIVVRCGAAIIKRGGFVTRLKPYEVKVFATVENGKLRAGRGGTLNDRTGGQKSSIIRAPSTPRPRSGQSCPHCKPFASRMCDPSGSKVFGLVRGQTHGLGSNRKVSGYAPRFGCGLVAL